MKNALRLSIPVLFSILAFGIAAPAAFAATAVVYDAIPNPLPSNMGSFALQANQTSEFGDYVHLAGTNRALRTVTVTMSDWALHSAYPSIGAADGWAHPITLNIYNAVSGTPLNTKGSLIGTVTQTFTIPWRPEGDQSCPILYEVYGWKAGDDKCYNGYAFNIMFDLSSLNVTLPNDVIVGVAYNTQSFGAEPIGIAGPYNSLNIGEEGATTVGTDDSSDRVFFNTLIASHYTDGDVGNVGVFREDTDWAPRQGQSFSGQLPIQITAAPVSVTSPSLGVAASYGVLSSTYINTSASTAINGDVGFTTGPTQSPLGTPSNYGSTDPYSAAGTAQATALANLNGQGCTFTFNTGAVVLSSNTQHGSSIYTPGVYCIVGGAVSIGSTITLSGAGTYIFRSAGALNAEGNSIVALDGASADDVFWTPDGATTLNANSTFIGTVIPVSQPITLLDNVSWTGRALAFGGTVTTGAADTISVPGSEPSASLTSATITANGSSIGDLNGATLATTDSGSCTGDNPGTTSCRTLNVSGVTTANGNLSAEDAAFTMQATEEQKSALTTYFAALTGTMATQIASEIAGSAPFFYFVSNGSGTYSLADGFKWGLGAHNQPLVIDDNYPAGTYTFTGTIAGVLQTVTLTVTKPADTTAPTATVVQSGQTITYTFDEAVQLTNNDGSVIATEDIASKLAVYAVTGSDYGTATKVADVEITDATVSGNVWTLTYTGTLVAQTNVKYVVDAWGYKIVDLVGNKTLPSESTMFTVTGVDTIAPSIPVINTAAQYASTTDMIHIIGTAEADSTVTITGGASTATGIATGGNYDIIVTLTHNAANHLSVTAKDASNNVSSPATVAITHDNVAPTGTIVINDGATYTNNNSVTLTLSAGADLSGVTEMNIANASSYAGWETYSTTKTWTLVGTDGTKTVRVQFRDASGNETATGIPDTIILDTTAPTATVAYDITTPTNTNVIATITPNETVTGALTHTFTGNGNFTFNFTDLAGNTGSVVATVSNIDKTAPANPTISTPVQSVNTDTIDIAGTAETNSTVTVTGGASTATSTATSGYYSIPVTLTHNAVNNLSVTAKDASNNVGSAATVAITHDDISSAPANLEVGSPTLTTLALSWTNNESNGSFYTIKRSTSEITADNFDDAPFLSSGPTIAPGAQGYTAKNLTANTTYYFAIKLTDAVGNDSDIATTSGMTASSGGGSSSSGVFSGGGVVTADVTAPAAITNLSLSAGPIATSQIVLNWNATGDDGSTGIATKYVIKRSLSAITVDNFDAATTVFNSISPSASSSPETLTVSGLTAYTTYYFAIKVQDEVPNTSTISNIENATTADNLPTITSVSPTTNQNDSSASITVTGTNFAEGATTVRFTNSANTFDLIGSYVSATQVTATVLIGAPAGVYGVRVIDANGMSAVYTSAYTVTDVPDAPLPAVTDIVPSNIGDNDADVKVEIYGTGFTDATNVAVDDGQEFGTIYDLASFTVVSDTKITGTINGTLHTGTYTVEVTTPAGVNAVSAVQITVTAPVQVDSSDTKDVVTDKPIDIDTATIPVQITMQSSTEDSTLDNNTTIEVVISPDTSLTTIDKETGETVEYEGNINPPQLVKPTEEIAAAAGDNAVVITMGNPNETIIFSQSFVTTVTLESTNSVAPLIWYYNPSAGLTLAGITGTKDGVDYIPGGTLLNTVDNGNGTFTYTIGLLLDHMSSYVAGVTPTISSISPTSGVAGSSVVITGTNFSPGAVVKFGSTVASVTANSVTQLTVTAPSIGIGSYGITVTNTDALAATSPTNFTVTVVSNGGGGGGGSSCGNGFVWNSSKMGCDRRATPAIPAVPGVSPATPAIPQGRVLGAAVYNFAKNLTVGSRGADVTALQQFLINSGYAIPAGATGFYGVQTKTAVLAFQKAKGIAQVGAVGPLTRAELNKGSSSSSLTSAQVNSIAAVLQSFGVDEATMVKVRAALAK